MIRTASPVEDRGKPNPRVVAIIGSRGGVGCTSIAVNLGCTIAEKTRNSVALVDLDLALGDADVALDLIPSRTLADAASNVPHLDEILCQHETGLFVLAHPTTFQDIELISEQLIQEVIHQLRASKDLVLIDASKHFTAIDIAALTLADIVLLVTDLELSGLRNTVRILLELERQELAGKVKILLNRVGSEREDISLEQAVAVIGKPAFCEIPYDPRVMSEARALGVPLVTKTPLSKVQEAITRLLDTLWS